MSIKRQIYKLQTRKRQIRLLERFGMRLLLDSGNYIDRQLCHGTLFEAAQLEKMRQLVEQHHANVFLDVGANFGLYSVYLGNHCSGLDKILAFEPDRRNFQQLCGNVFANRLSGKITPLQFGLSDRIGETKFLQNAGDNTGLSRIESKDGSQLIKNRKWVECTIALNTLDNHLSAMVGETLALKVDVEGHEINVMNGARQLLKNNRCILQIEIWPDRTDKVIAQMRDEFGLKHLEQVEFDHYFVN